MGYKECWRSIGYDFKTDNQEDCMGQNRSDNGSPINYVAVTSNGGASRNFADALKVAKIVCR